MKDKKRKIKVFDLCLFVFCGYIKVTHEIVSDAWILEEALKDFHEAIPENRYWKERYQIAIKIRRFLQSGLCKGKKQ